jgi:A/G-specific adenine glycosylase
MQKEKVISSSVLKWQSLNGRDFPWRNNPTDYQTLVAEILLQHTRAENVVETYRRFIKRYPTAEKLARARRQSVEHLIEPLGLRYRAKVLINIAQIITKDFASKMPNSKHELLLLPGVGEYIANGILCFSQKEQVVPVDTNVERIVCRIYALDYPVRKTATKVAVKRIVEEISANAKKVDTRNLAYGFLDLAALICKYSRPNHHVCPLERVCETVSAERSFEKVGKA